jgi:outer membrane protein, multidrug efflux system
VKKKGDASTGRMGGVSWTFLVVLTIIAVVGGNGCGIKPIPLTEEEVQSRARADRAVLTNEQEPLAGPVDLYEARSER